MTAEIRNEPPTRLGRKRARTRAQLVAAARRVFGRKGLETATIAEIAEEADVGFGTFYNYFDSKDAVIDAVTLDVLEQHARSLEALRGLVGDPAALVAMGLRLTVALAQADPLWAGFIVRFGLGEKRLWQPLRQRLAAAIAQGIARGRFHMRAPDVLEWAIGGAMVAVMTARLRDELPESAGEELAVGVLRLLGVPADEADAIARAPLPQVRHPAEPVDAG